MINFKKFLSTMLQLISCILLSCTIGNKAKAEPTLGIGTSQTNSDPSNISNIQQRLVNQYYSQKKYKEAVQELDKLLASKPNDIDLLMKKAGILADMEKYSESIAILDRVIQLDPNNEKAILLRQKLLNLEKKIPKNELGLDWDQVNVSGPKQWWQYGSIHYYRFTNFGTFGGRVNYANRRGTSGEQYQLEAYPKFFNAGVLALSYAYANSTQIVFPQVQWSIEPYLALPQNFEFSLGERYLRSVGISIYDTTASLGKYIGNYFIWMRDYHFTPDSADYFELGATRYFETKHSFITLKGAFGTAPDIADLAPLNQLIILKMYSVNVTGQTNLTECLIGRLGAGYMHQKFPSGNIRNFVDLSVGLYWQF